MTNPVDRRTNSDNEVCEDEMVGDEDQIASTGTSEGQARDPVVSSHSDRPAADDTADVREGKDSFLARVAPIGVLLTAAATVIVLVPTVINLSIDTSRLRADIGKVSTEIDTLRAQEESLKLSTAQLAPSFDYQYLSVLADVEPPTAGAVESRGSGARSWASPVASPVFEEGVAPAERGYFQGPVGHHSDIPQFLSSEECRCPILKAMLQAPGVSYSGLKSTYLGVSQLGKVPAFDVRLQLRQYHPGELSFFSLDELEGTNNAAGPTIEVSLGSLDTGEARLVPLFASVGAINPLEGPFQTNVGTAYLPVSISWQGYGQEERTIEEVRGALAEPVLLEGGLEARG